MEEEFQQDNYYEQPNFIVASIKCNKCYCYSNINVNPEISPEDYNKIQMNFLCMFCSNNVKDYHNIMIYINTQISNMIHKNKFTFRKLYYKINTLMTDFDKNSISLHTKYYKIIEQLQHYDNINEKNKLQMLDIENECKRIIDIHNQYKSESMIMLEEKLSKKEFVMEIDKIKEFEKTIQIIKKSIPNHQPLIDKHTKQLQHIENRITNLNTYMLKAEKRYENDYKDVNEKLSIIIMKNQEYKELKQLKKDLMINKKEYNKFKEKINLFYDYLYFIYALIAVNIVFILLYLFDKYIQ